MSIPVPHPAFVSPPVQVLIVEDHPLYRDALAHVLAQVRPDAGRSLQFSSAASQAEALDWLAWHPEVELVVADHRLRQGDGLALLEAVGQRWPTVLRVLMSGAGDPGLGDAARRLGLMGYLPKSLEPRQLVEAIEGVLAGEPWFPGDDGAADGDRQRLTERQVRVLACVAAGQSNKEAARALGVSIRTIKYHLEGIYVRLGAANRTEAVASALAQGWLPPAP